MKMDLKTWSTKNRDIYRSSGIITSTVVGTVFNIRGASSQTQIGKDSVKASSDLVWDIIEKLSTPFPVDFISATGIVALFNKIIKFLASLLGKPFKLCTYSPFIYDALVEVGNGELTKENAIELISSAFV